MFSSLQTLDVRNRKVLLRVDFNVPLGDGGRVADDSRIRAALPTLEHLLKNGAAVIVMSHLGRPKGKPDPRYSLRSVAEHLRRLMPMRSVRFAADCIGPEARASARDLHSGEVLMLENLRYHPEEEKNDEAFAAALASLGDVYVNDAFGVSHRAHASVEAIVRKISASAGGFLLEAEVLNLGRLLENPPRPFVAVIGGAKLETKVAVIRRLLGVADHVLVGGGLVYTLLKAQGMAVGASLADDALLDTAAEIMAAAEEKEGRLVLPEDHVTAPQLVEGAPARLSAVSVIEPSWGGYDIGPETVDVFRGYLAKAASIFWNGPMGVIEVPPFHEGTEAVARAVAESRAVHKVAGGGETLLVIQNLNLASRFTHLSTGGGASLEFIAGKELPGIRALGSRS